MAGDCDTALRKIVKVEVRGTEGKMSEYREPKDIKMEVNEPMEDYNVNRDFTSLEAWKKAREVKLFFYKKVLPKLPIKEKYNLDIQIRKAAVSSTSNISEG